MVTKFAEGAAEAGGSREGGGGESVQRGLAFGVRQRLPANVTGKTGKWPAKKGGGGGPGGGRRGGEGGLGQLRIAVGSRSRSGSRYRRHRRLSWRLATFT